MFTVIMDEDNSLSTHLSHFRTNIRSLKHHLDSFQTHLLNEQNFHFNVIGVTETRIHNEIIDFNSSIPNNTILNSFQCLSSLEVLECILITP